MKKPIRTPLTDDQKADAQRLSDIYKVRTLESRARGDKPVLTQTEVGERCGWSSPQSMVSQYMNAKAALNLDALVRLAKALDFDPIEVSPILARGITIGGKADAKIPLAPKPDFGKMEEATVDDKSHVIIPQYYAYAAAGSGHENPHVSIRGGLAFKRDWLRIKGVNPKNLKVIYADGESMWPTINDHDVLLVDESQIDPLDGHIFVIESQDRGTIVKRLVKSEIDGWIIRSDNADKITYGDEVLPDGEIYEHRVLGRVIWRGGDL